MVSDHFRAHARRPVSLSATLHTATRTWRADVTVVDLGLGGAGLLSHAGPIPHDEVELELPCPGLWGPLVLPGLVRWSALPHGAGGTRAGMAFRHRRADHLRALLELLADGSAG